MPRKTPKPELPPDVESICRRYIELRYQLLPYLYCLFAEAHRSGAPIMRPLLWHYQDDPVAVAVDDQFLLGENLLIAPIVRQGAVARSVYLPRGTWFNFWTGERHAGRRHIVAPAPLESIPLFVRAGAIIPIGPLRQFVGAKEPNTITLRIWPGLAGKLDWYEDDGHSMSHGSGAFHRRRIRCVKKGNRRILEFGAVQGAFPSEVRRWRVIWQQSTRPGAAVNVLNAPKAFRLRLN